jgi:hypothetical protein
MPKIAEVKLSSCRLEGCGLWKKLRLRNCGVAVEEETTEILDWCGRLAKTVSEWRKRSE